MKTRTFSSLATPALSSLTLGLAIALGFGCSNEEDLYGPHATAFAGFWVVESATLYRDGQLVELSRTGEPDTVRGDVLITPTAEREANALFRWALLDDGLLPATGVAVWDAVVSVEGDHWVVLSRDATPILKPLSLIYDWEWQGDALVLTQVTDDPRNTGNGPQSFTIRRHLPWTERTPGDWNVSRMIYADGHEVTPTTCQPATADSYITSGVRVFVDDNHLLREDTTTQAWLDDECTVEIHDATTTSTRIGFVEETLIRFGNETPIAHLGWWIVHPETGDAETATFNVIGASTLRLDRMDCLPAGTCDRTVPQTLILEPDLSVLAQTAGG